MAAHLKTLQTISKSILHIIRLNFFGQYIECDNLMLPVYCFIRERRTFCSD
jgi:hypothetical protein